MLENEADICAAVSFKIALAEGSERITVGNNISFSYGVKTAKEVKEGGFTATALTDNKDQARVRKLQVNILEGNAFAALLAVIHLSQFLKFNHIILLAKNQVI